MTQDSNWEKTDPALYEYSLLLAHFQRSTMRDLIPEVPHGQSVTEEEMDSWDATHNIDALDLRRLLLLNDASLQFIIRGARISQPLWLDRVITNSVLELQDCLLDDGLSVVEAQLPSLYVMRCHIRSSGSNALNARSVRISNELDIRGSVLRSDSSDPTIQLLNARIGANLILNGASISNTAGPALVGSPCRVDGAIFLRDEFNAVASDRTGAIQLLNADVESIQGSGASVINSSGPGLYASGMQVTHSVFLDETFRTEGQGAYGSVCMIGAKIGGQLGFRGAVLTNGSGPALNLDRSEIGDNLYLNQEFIAKGSGERATVRLFNTHVKGIIDFRDSEVSNSTIEGFRWVVDGLSYSGIPLLAESKDNRSAWLELFRSQTVEYSAQPYRQLAAAYQSGGDDGDVRAILMAQRRDQLYRNVLTRRTDRLWSRITRILLGYGYQPWRALIGLALVLGVSVGINVFVGGDGGLGRVPNASSTSGQSSSPNIQPTETVAYLQCSSVQKIGRGLDLGAPFLPVAPATPGACQPTQTQAGDIITITKWFLQSISWALAALFIVGFTGIVRKT